VEGKEKEKPRRIRLAIKQRSGSKTIGRFCEKRAIETKSLPIASRGLKSARVGGHRQSRAISGGGACLTEDGGEAAPSTPKLPKKNRKKRN